MLSAEQVSSIERLIREGWNGRQIARQLGHSRSTVRSVVHGRHCLVRVRQHEVEEVLDTLMIGKKILPDRPRPRVLRSPAFRFHLGATGLVFYARLHPPISLPAESDWRPEEGAA